MCLTSSLVRKAALPGASTWTWTDHSGCALDMQVLPRLSVNNAEHTYYCRYSVYPRVAEPPRGICAWQKTRRNHRASIDVSNTSDKSVDSQSQSHDRESRNSSRPSPLFSFLCPLSRQSELHPISRISPPSRSSSSSSKKRICLLANLISSKHLCRPLLCPPLGPPPAWFPHIGSFTPLDLARWSPLPGGQKPRFTGGS